MRTQELPTEEAYFLWLYDLVDGELEDPSRTHLNLIKVLHTTPFEWFVPNDDNRASDGTDLRYEFRRSYSLDDESWLDLDCSMLEMLIALARRMSFEGDQSPRDCFWTMLANIQVSTITDEEFSPYMERYIRTALDKVNKRTYGYFGDGGLFPLRKSQENQQYVELLYQMSAYLLENDRELYG